ncbi:hypothetical protein A2U01_0052696, partial [Trifolium medium]|nr:hypothetical protein [Trifolium medium]
NGGVWCMPTLDNRPGLPENLASDAAPTSELWR